MSNVVFQCPNCAGKLHFDPNNQVFRCGYCSKIYNEDQIGKEGVKQATAADDANLYHCPNCGANLVSDGATARCYYCHSDTVLTKKMSGDHRPEYIIPFQIGKEEALKSFDSWVGKKKFVPKAFQSTRQVETITGTYFPYWLASYTVHGKLEGTGKKTRTWRDGDIRHTVRETYRVVRHGVSRFKHIPVSALKKEDTPLVDYVHPFKWERVVPYEPQFLTGFQAENRNVDRNELDKEVQDQVETAAYKLLKQQVKGYASFDEKPFVPDEITTSWRHVLLPVWTITYKDAGGKLYYFAMNGQTGKVDGVLPLNRKKLLAFASGVAAVLYGILTAWYMWG